MIVETVFAKIKGAKAVTEKFEFVTAEEDEKEERAAKTTKVDEIKTYLLKLPKGIHNKKEIREALSI